MKIIHLGPPEDIEGYLQAIGRAGRDGLPACAVLMFRRPRQHVEESMLEYCNNTTLCRRELLLKDFDEYGSSDIPRMCMCCDICIVVCECSECM